MLMATAVSQLAEKTPGKESVAIESFARALRQVIEHIFLWNFLINLIFSYQQLLPIMLVMIVLN
jgi:T-complex protein 1 subunit beta